jgi:hypothetical protein
MILTVELLGARLDRCPILDWDFQVQTFHFLGIPPFMEAPVYIYMYIYMYIYIHGISPENKYG